MSTAAAVKRLTHRPDAPALYLIPTTFGGQDEAHRADVEWAVGHYSREVELYEATPTNPDAVSAASHLRHWQAILAAIDAFEGVAA